MQIPQEQEGKNHRQKREKIKIKAKAIEDLLYSSGNEVVVRNELDQYCHLFKLISTHHEEYCKLLDAKNQRDKGNCFDELGQDVLNFKHKV